MATYLIVCIYCSRYSVCCDGIL